LVTRIVVPSENQNGLSAPLAEHFGRAPYFTVVDLEENGAISNVESVLNVSEHAGGSGIAPDHILSLKPTTLIVYDMGARAIDIFENAGVPVLRADSNKVVNEVVVAYKENKLRKLTEGCGHTHVHHQ
jgi:predicted Fe-Mo cluster-binding NifX family protein